MDPQTDLRIAQLPHDNGAADLDGSATRSALHSPHHRAPLPLPGQTLYLRDGTEGFFGRIDGDKILVFPLTDAPCFWAPRADFTTTPPSNSGPAEPVN